MLTDGGNKELASIIIGEHSQGFKKKIGLIALLGILRKLRKVRILLLFKCRKTRFGGVRDNPCQWLLFVRMDVQLIVYVYDSILQYSVKN